MTDAEVIAAAEALARGGETARAVDQLWALVRTFADRVPSREARFADRRAALELLVTLAPEDVDVACAFARLVLPQDAKAALPALQGALRVAPRSVQVLRMLAQVQQQLGDGEKALETYVHLLDAIREGVAAGDSELDARQKRHLGDIQTYARYGLPEKADEEMQRFREHDYLDAPLYFLMAELARTLRRHPDRGAEYEIFAVLIEIAHGGMPRVLLETARMRYPEFGILRALEERLAGPRSPVRDPE